MKTRRVIAGVTFAGFASAPPVIPGLVALGFFGSGFDATNSNRAPGGTFVDTGSGPAYGTNYATVNSGSTTAQGIDLGSAETTGVAASGWTLFCVARKTVTDTTFATIMGIGLGTPVQLAISNRNTLVSNRATVSTLSQASGGSLVAPNCLDLGAADLCATYRFYASVFSGGTGGTYTTYDITGGLSLTPSGVTHTRTGHAANHFNVGYQGVLVSAYALADVAFCGVATEPLTLSDLESIRDWAAGPLSVRGITGI